MTDPSPHSYQAAVCQVTVDIDDAVATRQAASAALSEAVTQGARLVVLPELVLSGYVFADADEARRRSEGVEGPTLDLVRSVRAPAGTVVVAGFCEAGPGGRVYSSALVIENGTVLAVHRKTHLWATERDCFSAGEERSPVVETGAGRIGVAICYELEFPEWTRDLALRGADVVAAPCNWPSRGPDVDPDAPELVLARAAAAGNGVYVTVADRTGTERGTAWVGGSLIADPVGQVLTRPAQDGPAVLVGQIEIGRSRDKRRGHRNHLLQDRRPDLYPRLGQL